MVKVLVLGDLMIDHYVWGTCDRISPEAPVQVINAKKETKRLGAWRKSRANHQRKRAQIQPKIAHNGCAPAGFANR